MVQAVNRDERTVWVMPRDESMFTWFSIVRIADVQSVRWVLGALNRSGQPVSVRRAQAWCARMQSAGLVDRAQLGGRGGSLVWATYASTGLGKPNLYRQTTRHEVAVAAASARYATAGYAWQRDEKPATVGGHQADGIALAPRWVELVEVELTAKRMPRYASIFSAYRRRLDYGDGTAITYLCTDAAARAVRQALGELPAGRAIAPRVEVHPVYDERGYWDEELLPSWLPSAADRARF
ncbi:hypothetical protein [Amnibacterium kyonggiense]|uniref:Protein involved in plasmid replication-relaxation n=1 Tax=Amnibacterium kyonggiense TaxID=595671 RepID=A0A4R7FPK9_9MICO|nr:hypothetical protein [Amnibacterium kyonggiense]TDS79509.1 hypothetical protein CLV52_0038 [Amnibacterium kyonggiense]